MNTNLPAGRAEHRLWKGSKATLLLTATSMVIGVLQVRLLLGLWGAENYACWMVVAAAIGVLGAMDAGLGTYIGNQITRSWNRDQQKVRIFAASGVLAVVGLALVLLAATGLLIWSGHTSFLFGQGFSENGAGPPAHSLVVFLVFWACMGAPAGLLGKMYAPAGQFERFQRIMTVQRLAGFGLLLAAVALGAGIGGAMLAQCAAWALIQGWMIRDIQTRFPHLFPLRAHAALSQAAKDFRASLMLSLVFLVYQAGFSGYLFLAARDLDPIAVAMFSVHRTAANLLLQISAIQLHPLSPEMVRYHETKEREKLLVSLRIACLLGTTVTSLLLLAGVGLAPWIFGIWTGGVIPFASDLFYLLIAAVAVRLWASPFVVYLQGINALVPQLRVEIARSVPGLGLALCLIPFLGLSGLGWGCLAGEVTAAFYAWKEGKRAVGPGPEHASRRVVPLTVFQMVIFLVALLVVETFPPWAIWACLPAALLILTIAIFLLGSFPNSIRKRIIPSMAT